MYNSLIVAQVKSKMLTRAIRFFLPRLVRVSVVLAASADPVFELVSVVQNPSCTTTDSMCETVDGQSSGFSEDLPFRGLSSVGSHAEDDVCVRLEGFSRSRRFLVSTALSSSDTKTGSPFSTEGEGRAMRSAASVGPDLVLYTFFWRELLRGMGPVSSRHMGSVASLRDCASSNAMEDIACCSSSTSQVDFSLSPLRRGFDASWRPAWLGDIERSADFLSSVASPFRIQRFELDWAFSLVGERAGELSAEANFFVFRPVESVKAGCLPALSRARAVLGDCCLIVVEDGA